MQAAPHPKSTTIYQPTHLTIPRPLIFIHSKFLSRATMQTQPFKYTPLPPSSFRLLTLHPGPRTSPLHLSLTLTTHALSPAYAALSYTWDPPSSSHPLQPCYINSHPIPFPIQQNLYTAL